MSPEAQPDGRSAANVHELPIQHASDIRVDLLALRTSVTLAWKERAVMLTREEQKELRAEIRDLCQYLTDLTGPVD